MVSPWQLSLVVAAVFGVIVYRLAVMTLFQQSNDVFWLKSAKIATSITAATLNLIIIMIMNQVRLRELAYRDRKKWVER